jgi:2-polyprenyl-3-methyl-5-hydroxy-6-metoxy-1,4-benzoquinol methylase
MKYELQEMVSRWLSLLANVMILLGRLPRRWLILINVLVVVGLLMIGLWSFKFSVINSLLIRTSPNCIEFSHYSVAYTDTISGAECPLSSGRPLAIEMAFQPIEFEMESPIRFLTLCSPDFEDVFTMNQRQADFIIMIYKNEKVIREIEHKNVFKTGLPVFISVIAAGDSILIGINASFNQKCQPNGLADIVGNWNLRLVLGNSPRGNAGLDYRLYLLALYNQALTENQITQHYTEWQKTSQLSGETKPVIIYAFKRKDGGGVANGVSSRYSLIIPSKFKILKKSVLMPPWKYFRGWSSLFIDVLFNIVGFLPFGFFFFLLVRNRSGISFPVQFWFTVLIGFSLSLVIEITQVFLPHRYSQIQDLISNSIGTACGVLIAIQLLRWAERRQKNGPLNLRFQFIIFRLAMANKEVADFFDRFAIPFDTFYEGKRSVFLQWFDRNFRRDMFLRFSLTFEKLGDLSNASVLDIGCGSGIYLAESLKRGAKNVTGIDPAPKMLDLTSQRLNKAGYQNRFQLVNGFFPEAPIPHHTHAIVMGVMDYVSDPKTFLIKLQENVENKACISFPSWHWLRSPIRKFRYAMRRCPIFLYSEPQLREILRQAGCEKYELIKIPGAGMDFHVTICK